VEIAISRRSIAAAAALAAAEAAVAHARARDRAVVSAVVDASGDLVALLRADGAFKASIGIARDKAYTAAVFGASTDDLSAALSANPTLHQGIGLQPGVILFGGGLPIIVGDQVIGGIGVSGGTEDDDRACARAGLAALGLG
jgi:uncharacterized protein GlcG (DUF336 family)